MYTVFQDVRYAFRTFIRYPLFTLAAIITLAMGIGANTAIVSLIQPVLIQPLPVEAPDRWVSPAGPSYPTRRIGTLKIKRRYLMIWPPTIRSVDVFA